MRRLVAVSFFTALAAPACQTTPAEDVTVDDSGAVDDAKADSSNSLTTAKSKLVLQLIDDACGDSWCEGDFGWSFKKLVCHYGAGTCTLTTLVTRPAFEGVPEASFWRSCKMTGIDRFTALVTTAPNGFQSLADSFYTKVDACATKIEASIPTH